MLRTENIKKKFKHADGEYTEVLKGVSFSLESRGVTCLIGANGSGKSTLLKIIAGRIAEDQGSIFLDENKIHQKSERYYQNMFGWVPQRASDSCQSGLSLEANMRLAYLKNRERSIFSRSGKNFREIAKSKLALLGMGLENKLDKELGSFSGGQQQAVTLAMSLISEPRILLMDEATSALDPRSANILMQVVKKLCQEGQISVLMITHKLEEALEFGDKILILKNGLISKEFRDFDKAKLKPTDLALNQ